jgi:uncharacterized coiled-coil protein SlyX
LTREKDANKKTDMKAEIQTLNDLLPGLKKAAENVKGDVARATAELKEKRAVKEEMDVIDKMQRELNDLYNKMNNEKDDNKMNALNDQITKKQASFDKLINAKFQREEAERMKREEDERKNYKNELRRRKDDLNFEMADLTAALADPTLDEYIRDELTARLAEIPDDIQRIEDELNAD